MKNLDFLYDPNSAADTIIRKDEELRKMWETNFHEFIEEFEKETGLQRPDNLVVPEDEHITLSSGNMMHIYYSYGVVRYQCLEGVNVKVKDFESEILTETAPILASRIAAICESLRLVFQKKSEIKMLVVMGQMTGYNFEQDPMPATNRFRN